MKRSHFVCPFFLSPVVHLGLLQLLNFRYSKLNWPKRSRKCMYAKNIHAYTCQKILTGRGCEGTEKTRKLSKIEHSTDHSSSEPGPATHLLLFWASFHTPQLIVSSKAFFVPLLVYLAHSNCRLPRAETIFQPLFVDCALVLIGISKMKLCSLV